MPREQINTPARRTITQPTKTNGLEPGSYGLRFTQDGDTLHEGESWENTPVLHVGWHREGEHGLPDTACLQFHMEVDADEVLRAADEIRRTRENPDLYVGHKTWTFSTVLLTRHEAQKAIKVTRRARDAAFGADE